MSRGCIILCLVGLFCTSQSLDVTQISDAINQFGVDILDYYVNNEKAGNVVFSPYSLWTLMQIMSEGTSGATRSEILKAAHVSQWTQSDTRKAITDLESKLEVSLSPSVKINSKNGIFIDKDVDVKDDFREQLVKYYGTAVENIDSENVPNTVNQINVWAANNINSKLRDIATNDDVKGSNLILLNALLFSADWKIPFYKSRTFESGFYAERYEKDEPWKQLANVTMMTTVGLFPFSYNVDLRADVAELPYKGDQYSLLLISPDYGLNNTVSVIRSSSVRKVYADLIESQKEVPSDAIKDVQILLPKFAISYDHEIKNALTRLGVQTVFGENASFTSMAPNKINLKRILHKAGIVVKESSKRDSESEGKEYMYKMYPAELRAEQPFIFFIMDKIYNTVMFAGLVRNPNGMGVNVCDDSEDDVCVRVGIGASVKIGDVHSTIDAEPGETKNAAPARRIHQFPIQLIATVTFLVGKHVYI